MALIADKEFEKSIQYIADETEVIGIIEKQFILDEGLCKTSGNPFILDLAKPVVLEFFEQSPVHSLQEVPWDYSDLLY